MTTEEKLQDLGNKTIYLADRMAANRLDLVEHYEKLQERVAGGDELAMETLEMFGVVLDMMHNSVKLLVAHRREALKLTYQELDDENHK